MNKIRAHEIKPARVSHRWKQSQTDNGRIPTLPGYGALSTQPTHSSIYTKGDTSQKYFQMQSLGYLFFNMDNTQSIHLSTDLGLSCLVCNTPVCSAANGDLRNLLYPRNCIMEILEGMTKTC